MINGEEELTYSERKYLQKLVWIQNLRDNHDPQHQFGPEHLEGRCDLCAEDEPCQVFELAEIALELLEQTQYPMASAVAVNGSTMSVTREVIPIGEDHGEVIITAQVARPDRFMSTRQIGGFTKVILAVHDYHDYLKNGIWPDERD